MNEQQRWIIFIVLAMMIMLYFSITQAKRSAEYQKQQAEAIKAQEALQTGATEESDVEVVVVDDDGTTIIVKQTPKVSAAPATLVTTQQEDLEAWMSAEKRSISNDKIAIDLSTYGGRVESWRVIDPAYSVSYKHAVQEGVENPIPAEYGDELVMDYLEGTGVPSRPLELSLVANAKNFREFNSAKWDIKSNTDSAGGSTVTMTSPAIKGLQVVKELRLPPDSYSAALKVTVKNVGDSNFRVDNEGKGLGILGWGAGLGVYEKARDYFDSTNPIYYIDEATDIDIDDLPATIPTEGLKWAAISNKYMLAGVLGVDGTDVTNLRVRTPSGFSVEKNFAPPYMVEAFVEPFTLAPGSQAFYEYEIFAAPKTRKYLSEIGKEKQLQRAFMYDSWNWFRALSMAMLWMLELFHGWIGSWGLAIIMLTITMKVITHPINHHSLRINAEFQRQMAKMKPEMDELAKKYKDSPQEKMAEQQKLMKKHGVNPLAPLRGCLPMFLQIPIFFALYKIIGQSIALRGETFLWIDDLAAPDALVPGLLFGMDLNIMPLLMVGTQILAMRLSSRASAQDPNQKMMLYLMPVMMLFLLYNFAAGLFVYWVMQNIWQVGHTLLTNREVDHEAEEKEAVEAEVAATAPVTTMKERRKKKN